MEDLSKFAIGCISDEKYIPLLKVFLSSIAKNYPRVAMYITLVNCPEYADELKQIYPDIEFKFDTTELSTKRNRLARHDIPVFDYLNVPETRPIEGGFRGPRWLMSDRAAYCSNIRYRVILEMMEKGYNPILFMDVDAIIRKPLDELGKLIWYHDICIMQELRGFRDPTYSAEYAPPDFIDWHCGIIGSNNNEICKEFFTVVKDSTEADMLNWDADQDEFNKAYHKFKDKLSMYFLPIKFKDEGKFNGDTHQDDSHIWCGAGEIKYSNKQYIQEQQKYYK